MADITSTPFGAAEHCRLDNWAAEYAKKLFVAEAAKRTEEITNITKSGGTIDQRIAEYDREIVDPIEEDIEELEANKVGRTDYASTEQAGVIKLHKLNSYNNSGIIVEADGSAYVYTGEQYGTQRSGDGRIQIAAATVAEINSGQQQYKPIVPATLKTAVEKYTGPASTLPEIKGVRPANLAAAVNALCSVDDDIRETIEDLVIQRGISAAEMQAALDELENELETQIAGQAVHHTTDVAGIWGTLGTSKDVEPLTPIKTGEISPRGTYYVNQPSSVTNALTLLSNALDYERNVRIAAVEGKVSTADMAAALDELEDELGTQITGERTARTAAIAGMQAALDELEDELGTQMAGEATARTTAVAGIWGTLGTSKDVTPLTPIKTGEISPRGTYYVNQPSSVTNALTLLSNALDYERNARMTYSTAPQRIGTWIDAVTPVWRAVIPSTAVTGGTLRLRDILSSLVSEPDDAVLIDHRIHFRNTPNSYDPNETSDSGTVSYDIAAEKWTINNSGAADPVQSYYGWVEFATAASNISN